MSAIPDVEFTYYVGTQQKVEKLRGVDGKSSREAIGIWHVGSSAWKVYRQRNQYDSLVADYARAATDAALPMGNPSFIAGDVKASDTGRTTQGFVLTTEWMDGTNFQKTDASFKSALTAQKVSHVTTDQDYIKTKRGCLAAQKVGLRDCQGFVNTGIRDTLRFIDIHTGWNAGKKRYDPSAQADALVTTIEGWAK